MGDSWVQLMRALRAQGRGLWDALSSPPKESSATLRVVPAEPEESARIEAIRAAMLALIQPKETDDVSDVTRRVQYAEDAQDLWFLRQDVLAVISRSRGEQVARQLVGQVTPLFSGLLPASLGLRASRPMGPRERD